VSKLYEPGSVIKAMTLAAALEEGVATLDTSYNDVGWMRVENFTIWDWDRVAHGRVDMRTMMRLSLNVGAVHLGQMLGPDRFYRRLRDFGFGVPTGIDVTGEVAGLIRDHKTKGWGELDLATNAFGQGMAATPIQVITAMAAIANGGHLMQPYVVAELRQGDTLIKENRPQPLRRVVSPQHIPSMHEALVGVIEQSVRASVPGYRLAGKTGSSQIPTEKGYDPELTIASFVGYGPVSDPRVVILVKVDKPIHRSLGSEVAAPFFGTMARQIFDYLDIPPDNARAASESRKPKPAGAP
jgi:cell division protein FtsI/penicillin-binding protein 2